MYHSTTKNKWMKESDMHMMHIENVLLKDLDESTLSWGGTNRLTREYIKKAKADREYLHKLLKTSASLNRLLFDILGAKPVYVPKKPVSVTTDLDTYRLVALGYIRRYGLVSADTLRTILTAQGFKVSGQTLTHVFRDKRFVQTHYRRSTWGGANGRFINTWKAA
jgi:hypothetical protein